MYYIKKHHEGIEIITNAKRIIKNTSLQRYLDTLCMGVLTTLEGRQKAMQKLTGYQRNTPLYIDEHLCFIQTNHLQDPTNIAINVTKVLSVKAQGQATIFIFEDTTRLKVDRPLQKIQKKLKRAEVTLALFFAMMKTLLSKKVFSK